MCSTPPGDNTVSAPEDLAVEYLGVYTYTCKCGYDTEDGVTAQCQADGTWSLGPPNCKCKLLLLLGVQLFNGILHQRKAWDKEVYAKYQKYAYVDECQ